MRPYLHAVLLTTALVLAIPAAALAFTPPPCTDADLANAVKPGSASMQNTNTTADIAYVFADLKPSAAEDRLDGVSSGTDIYYPFDTMTSFGFTVKVVVATNGRARCIALAPNYGRTIQPQWNAQRRAWARDISKWRFHPLVHDGKPVAAVTDFEVYEYELPKAEVPMPAGDPTQVVIIQDMPVFGYHVELHGDGRALYSSNRPDYVLGPQAYHVDPKAVAHVLQDAADADFWSLRDSYPADAAPSDPYESRIEITLGGVTKSLIDHSGGMNSGLTRDGHFFAYGIRHTVDVNFWWHPTQATIAQLQANGFDFTSAAAERYLLQIMANSGVNDATVLAVMALGAPRDAQGTSDDAPHNLLEAALSTGRAAIAGQMISDGALKTGKDIDAAKLALAFQAAITSGDLATADLILPYHPAMTYPDPDDPTVQTSVLFLLPNHDPEAAPTDLTQRLLDLGADVNARDSTGQTLLHRVLGNRDMIIFLLAHGADINAVDHLGQTPLVAGYEEDMAMFLLEHGADPRAGKDPQALRDLFSHHEWPGVRLWLTAHGYADIVTNTPPPA